MRHVFIALSSAASLCLTATLIVAAESSVKPALPLAQAKVAAICQGCHGPTGDSVSPIYPRLNGQQADYIVSQLKGFHSHRRDDTRARGYMWGIARELDDKTTAELGRYFASQKPTQPQTGGALASEGERIFMNGDPAKTIAACQQCHGKFGEGSGSFPRIAGQHAAYFRMVMGAFRSDLRANQTMHAVAKNMSDRQIEALSSYLSND